MSVVKCAEVWSVNFEPAVGGEIGKKRTPFDLRKVG